MKHRTKVILASGIGLIAVTGIAFAAKGYQDHKKWRSQFSPQKIIEQMDTNSDNAISLAEFNAAVDKRFVLADIDGDGSVQKTDVLNAIEANAPFEKMKRHSGRIADRLFVGMDIDDNGTVTRSEVENRLAKFYALADWNDDGKVEMAELKRLRASMPGRWGKRHGKDRKTSE